MDGFSDFFPGLLICFLQFLFLVRVAPPGWAHVGGSGSISHLVVVQFVLRGKK